jgi:hypothetical protein
MNKPCPGECEGAIDGCTGHYKCLYPKKISSKTPEEIEKLKQNWLQDPCWDIYGTEGFEEHVEELKKYQAEQERKWEKRSQQRLQEKANKMGIPDNLTLAYYIDQLEWRLHKAEEEIDKIKYK